MFNQVSNNINFYFSGTYAFVYITFIKVPILRNKNRGIMLTLIISFRCDTFFSCFFLILNKKRDYRFLYTYQNKPSTCLGFFLLGGF